MTYKHSFYLWSIVLPLLLTPSFAWITDYTLQETTVAVTPSSVSAAVGEGFSINISIALASDLYAWEFKLSWDPSLINASDVAEGTFLSTYGSTFFCFVVNASSGRLVVDCTLLGDVEGANGSGVLATIDFFTKNGGECLIDLHEVVLLDSSEQLVTCQATDGYGYFTHIHDVAVLDVSFSPLIAFPGESVNVTVMVQNQGIYVESFNIAAFANAETIGTGFLTLEAGLTEAVLIFWNTTGCEKGLYEISASASVAEGETDVADNSRVASSLFTLLSPGHDIALVQIEPLKPVVGQNYCTNIQVTVRNFGTSTETVNTTVYVNNTAVQSMVTILTSGEEKELIFTWNTTTFDKGNYTVSSHAWPVPEETEMDDNTLASTMAICVTIPGDVNADFDVDIYDIVKIAGAYGTHKGDTKYVGTCDIDNDEEIDIYDVVIAAGNYGKSTSSS